jgi:hypothetical protein
MILTPKLYNYPFKHRSTLEYTLQEIKLLILSSEAMDLHFFETSQRDGLCSSTFGLITATTRQAYFFLLKMKEQYRPYYFNTLPLGNCC